MDRIKGYLVYLLISAIPYLLMIYSPETVEPIYQYLANGKGNKYAWTILIFIILFSLYFGIVYDFKKSSIKENIINFTKWYLSAVGITTAIYIFIFDSPSFTYAILGAMYAVIAFYIYSTTYGKKNA